MQDHQWRVWFGELKGSWFEDISPPKFTGLLLLFFFPCCFPNVPTELLLHSKQCGCILPPLLIPFTLRADASGVSWDARVCPQTLSGAAGLLPGMGSASSFVFLVICRLLSL